jgi:c(7)-type cytochrome triheme protein
MDQRFKKFAENLPKKEFGDGIDWAQAIKNNAITPKNSLEGNVPLKLPTEHLLEPLRWNTVAPGVNVIFPHEQHIRWLDCSNCHPDIFDVEKLGTVSFDKEKYLSGRFCGSCHMRVAFPINNCSRCHTGVKDWAR